MRIAHAALWTRNLDEAAEFWWRTFGAAIGEPYRSRRRPGFVSRFVTLPGGAAIELMTGPWIASSPQGTPSGGTISPYPLATRRQSIRLRPYAQSMTGHFTGGADRRRALRGGHRDA